MYSLKNINILILALVLFNKKHKKKMKTCLGNSKASSSNILFNRSLKKNLNIKEQANKQNTESMDNETNGAQHRQ